MKILDDTWIVMKATIYTKRSMFVEFDESINGIVAFGDEIKVDVKEKGNILIRIRMDHINLYSVSVCVVL